MGRGARRAFALARYSYVAPAGDDAVLKVTPRRTTGDPRGGRRARALGRRRGGPAAPARPARRAHAARARADGTTSPELAEDEATAIAVATGLKLWRPASEPFRWIGDHVPWLARRAGATSSRRSRASSTRRSTSARTTLVHGDFHHQNILESGGGHVAIDPKPMLGEPEYDVPSCLWNPLSYRMRRDVTRAPARRLRRCRARRGADADLDA